MERFLFQNQSPDERRRILRDTADKIEETTYMKPLSEEELALRRELFCEKTVALGQLEDELDKVKDEFKAKMKPIKEENKTILYELKHRQTEVTGHLYSIADHEIGMMGTYNEDGELISSRRLRPEEKQMRITHITKAQ